MADQGTPNGRIPEEARPFFEELKKEFTPEVLKKIEQEIEQMRTGQIPTCSLEDLLQELEENHRKARSEKP
jgi:hypothetical protein